MKYYILKVKDTLNQEYYILNNQYIGYVGFDSQEIRSIVEHSKKAEQKYQLYAESGYIADGSECNQTLHELNCESTRFSHKEVRALMKDHPAFIRSKDRAWYKVYFPNRNSSTSYLQEIGGSKTIK